MKLWLVRHARPLVATGVCYGQWDVPVDASHTALAADDLCNALQREGVLPMALRSSPLQRTSFLAEALGERLGMSVHKDERLAEMHFGCWEGVPWAEIPKAAVDAWTYDFENHAFGGQECTRQVLERVWQALQEARAAQGPQLWVTHAGVIRAVQHLLRQGEPRIARADDWPREAPDYGAWVAMDL